MDSERFHDELMADTVGDRLKKARIAAGYLDASQAARSTCANPRVPPYPRERIARPRTRPSAL